MKRKTVLTIIMLSMLAVSMLAGLQAVNEVKANPFSFFWTYIDPIPGTIPPNITIFSPQNNTHYASRTVCFSFNATKPQSPVPVDDGVSKVSYSLCSADSLNVYDKDSTVYECTVYSPGHIGLPEFSFSDNLTLPEGNYSITVYAEGTTTIRDNMTVFWTLSNSTVYFAIDTTPPTISGISIENKTYNSTEVPLNFFVNENPSRLSYSMDNQANVTIAGNTTLTASSDGSHSIVIYAKDSAGNVGKSDTFFFTVDISAPSPTLDDTQAENYMPTIVILASAAIALMVGVLACLAKYKRQK